jgi:23S rRNA pseudouridine1911/1915/1917 synthase
MPPIIYEDDNIIALNKPAGLSVHGDGKTEEVTLADLLLKKHPKLKEVGEPTPMLDPKTKEMVMVYRPGIVHRLDKETSGIILIAKNQKSFDDLKKQFEEHTIKKIYNAFVYGWIKNDEGKVDAPIGRSPSDIRMWSAGRGKRGTIREALTEYKVLKRFHVGTKGKVTIEDSAKGSTEKGDFSYMEFYPKTGRTHQIRVHAKFMNDPIVSDPLYARDRDKALGFTRLALHARQITFKTLEGEKKTLVAPLPADFEAVLATL